MSIPLIQQYHVAKYVLAKQINRQKNWPLMLTLEPLTQDGMDCGCGKTNHPKALPEEWMSVDDALRAVDECGAPIVSIAGGEPLIHTELPAIVEGIIARGKYVNICTNALLLDRKLAEYQPSPYLTFSIHLDGNQKRDDESVRQVGVFEKAVFAIDAARKRGFRVTTHCTLFKEDDPLEISEFFDHVTALGVEGITLSPGYRVQQSTQHNSLLQRTKNKQLVRKIFSIGAKKAAKWKFHHSSLFLDFLAGNQTYQCTPWSNPTYNTLGWQKPCALLVGEGYAPSHQALMAETHWDRYGPGRNPQCTHCMAHCGYEGTAVRDTFAHPLKALKVTLLGPRHEGPMAAELPIRVSPSVD